MQQKYPNLTSLNLEIPKDIREQLNSIESDVIQLINHKNNKIEQYTINYIDINKSIIKEISDFSIVYTDDDDDKISYHKFIAYCDFKNIPKKITNTIVNDLSIINYKQNPTNIFKLKFINSEEFDISFGNMHNNPHNNINNFNDKNDIDKLVLTMRKKLIIEDTDNDIDIDNTDNDIDNIDNDIDNIDSDVDFSFDNGICKNPDNCVDNSIDFNLT